MAYNTMDATNFDAVAGILRGDLAALHRDGVACLGKPIDDRAWLQTPGARKSLAPLPCSWRRN